MHVYLSRHLLTIPNTRHASKEPVILLTALVGSHSTHDSNSRHDSGMTLLIARAKSHHIRIAINSCDSNSDALTLNLKYIGGPQYRPPNTTILMNGAPKCPNGTLSFRKLPYKRLRSNVISYITEANQLLEVPAGVPYQELVLTLISNCRVL